MGTAPGYLSSFGTDPTGQNLDWGTSDPRKIASQQRRLDASQYNQATGQQQDVAGYLQPIQSTLAEGRGGYNPSELSQIQMTPEQQQQIVTGAGISAGANTAAATGAAERAANATGGNPLALAAYRNRAASQMASNASDAMTQARIGASNAAATRAENIGQTRIGQQNEGLGYFNGLQQQYNQNAQSAANRQTAAGSQGLQASQTPSTFDKIVGGISGTLGALEDGAALPYSEGADAVVGEDGPEKVVQMEDGGMADDEENIYSGGPTAPTGSPGAGVSGIPWYKRYGQQLIQSFATPPPQTGAGMMPGTAGSGVQQAARAGGSLAKLFLEDGGAMPGGGQGRHGVFTKPTKVHLDPGEAVVPLGQNRDAKMPPRMAMMPAAKQRFGGNKHAVPQR